MKHKIAGKLKYMLFFIISLAVIIIVLDNTAKIIFPVRYKEFILSYSIKNNVDPYLVLAIIKTESNFNPNAVSPKKAKGLMQISDKTGQWGARILKLRNYSNESLFDPETNISIGCWYLNVLAGEFSNNSDLTLAAYNGGSGNVNEWLKNNELSSSGKSLDKIPFRETEMFLKKVNNYHFIYKRLYENDF